MGFNKKIRTNHTIFESRAFLLPRRPLGQGEKALEKQRQEHDARLRGEAERANGSCSQLTAQLTAARLEARAPLECF